MTTQTDLLIVAVWPWTDEHEPETARVFSPDEYADWAETNHLSGAFPPPAAFYGITLNGRLFPLHHTCDTSPYDTDDYATVTHTWTRTGRFGTRHPYTTGAARRDGRA